MSKVSIKDYCEITSSKRIFANEYLTSGVPFYRGREISEKHNSSSEVSDLIFISEEKYNEIKSKYGVPQKGDLLLTSVGTIGNPYLVKDNKEFYFKDGNLTWFRKFKGMNSKWFYYWLLSPQGRSELNKCTIGSSQKAYTINLLYKLQLDLPSLETQIKIASIISTYDDLIENNENRIRLFEEIAQRLYKEWFIKFKFPGHDKIKMIDSSVEYGKIPVGWKVVLMKDVANIVDCLHTKKPERVLEGDKFLLQLNNILDNGIIDLNDKFYIRDEDYKSWTKNIELEDGDCVVTNVGRIAATAQIFGDLKAAAGRNITVIRPVKIPPSFLIQYLKSPHMLKEVKKKIDAGAIMGSLNVKSIYVLKVLLPDANILKQFSDRVSKLRNKMNILYLQNTHLKQIRDLLIPQLIIKKRELIN